MCCVLQKDGTLNSSGSLNMANIMKNCTLLEPNYVGWKYRVDLYIQFYDYSSFKSECPPKPKEELVESDKIS